MAEVSEALRQIEQMTADSREREAYFRGTQDGALAAIAPALGVPATVQHQLMGRRFKLTIEWLDDDFPDPRHETVAQMMAAAAAERVNSRLAQPQIRYAEGHRG